MSHNQTDILIAGGGVAGLSLGLLLGQAGLRITIIEPYPPSALSDVKPSGRTVALMNGSLNVVRACDGVWDRIEPLTCRMEGMRIRDISRALKEPIELDFPASDIGLEQFGYNIPNGALRAALYDAVIAQEHISILNAKLADYQTLPTGVEASLEDGESLQARMIVGADGRGSKVRDIAGIDVTRKAYDQAAMTFIINHSHAHENVSTEFHKQHGPLALVPLPGNQSSVVWVESKARTEELLALSKGAFEDALMDKTDRILGGVTLETERESWPLCTIKAKALTAPRMALIAEAAHVMSPITAQGLNLSLRDVAALAESIVDAARLGVDIGSQSVLSAYEKRRGLDIDTRVFGVDHMNRMVSSEAKVMKDLRRLGLKTLEAVPAIKTLSMHVGLAPQMDMGRLVKGEAL
jgi:2-octaprenyl-6-methoxyphenol hydroxylase